MILTDEVFNQFCNKEKHPGDYVGGEGWLDTADMFQNMAIIRALTKCFSQDRTIDVLEIGVSDGTSSLAFLKGLKDRPKGGNLCSVDKDRCQDLAVKAIRFFELEGLWEYNVKDSCSFFQSNNREFDIVLVDGDHSYEGAKRDFEESLKILRPGGVILIHDTFMGQDSGNHSVSKLIKEIVEDGQFCAFVMPVAIEITYIQRKSEILSRIGNFE